MGIIILIIAFIFELAFAVYCVYTNSNQKKIRNIVRICSFVVFAILALVSIIEWGLRWYLLAILLLILAVIGCVSLIRNKENKKQYKLIRIVFKAIGMLLLVIIITIPALIFPQYNPPQMTGKYSVNTVLYTYTDKNRIETFNDNGEYREVNVEFWYPEDADGTYPLIVFSHGSFGIKVGNMSTYKELASNGYIVCSIDHPYHSFYTKNTAGKSTIVSMSYMQEFIDVNNGIYDEEAIYELFKKWSGLRAEDINFVLDTILEFADTNNADNVYRLIDTNKIGVIGQSLGGAATSIVVRERNDISASVNLEAPLIGELMGFQDGDMKVIEGAYPLPLLNIYTDDLWSYVDVWKQDVKYYANYLLLSDTADYVYNVNFEDAKHMSLSDLPLFSPILANLLQGGKAKIDKYYCIETMNGIILDFFNCYLKDISSFTPAKTY